MCDHPPGLRHKPADQDNAKPPVPRSPRRWVTTRLFAVAGDRGLVDLAGGFSQAHPQRENLSDNLPGSPKIM